MDARKDLHLSRVGLVPMEAGHTRFLQRLQFSGVELFVGVVDQCRSIARGGECQGALKHVGPGAIGKCYATTSHWPPTVFGPVEVEAAQQADFCCALADQDAGRKESICARAQRSLPGSVAAKARQI